MKVSLKWLQKYFDTQLPSAEKIADAYTFHAFEIEEIEGDMMDVKVLPNRAADCLSHRGLATELSAILNLPLTSDPLREALQGLTLYNKVKPCNAIKVEIEDPKKCARYMGALVKGVKVGPSPEWLREALLAVGQRSINNIVDATNYVMLNIGQPLHAFDAQKLTQKDGAYAIGVRSAREGEKITTLSGEEYTLTSNIQLITDAHADAPIALAGIKGGNAAELTEATTDIVVESANFDGTVTRRGAQTIKLFTDASLRFQNRPSPELAAYGMRDVLALIADIAGGEVIGVVDEYPARPEPSREVSVTLAKINGVLGSNFTKEEVEDVFKRLALPYMIVNDVFTVTSPFERTDLDIAEALVEEVGRIIGYDQIPATELPFDPAQGNPDQARYRG
ncbi:MAG: phenylalanine--tRNA ligase beta subunit-related protein, partial [Candidatus Pacebacteria bacterium]|nr:phenylalanine--tRNA ligase beta subunit-related protein [Candidatus Paceibacterota bacterium]